MFLFSVSFFVVYYIALVGFRMLFFVYVFQYKFEVLILLRTSASMHTCYIPISENQHKKKFVLNNCAIDFTFCRFLHVVCVYCSFDVVISTVYTYTIKMMESKRTKEQVNENILLLFYDFHVFFIVILHAMEQF